MPVAGLYWVDAAFPGRLAVAPRPRSADWLADEIRSWKSAGVDTVASLLCDDEIAEIGLRHEAEICAAEGMEFVRFPIKDRGVPDSMEEARAFVTGLSRRLAEDRAVLIHCRAGIGRTGMMAACCLVVSGVQPDEAFDRIAKARGMSVPDTEEQRLWTTAFAARHSSNTKSIR
jgi:protein-tyrosine phosphatase